MKPVDDHGTFNILTLDGGGSKGVYSVGFLKELEAHLGKPLHNHFQMIFGTSTGAIIAALISTGHSAKAIEDIYLDSVPKIMGKRFRATRSNAIQWEARKIFGDATFDAFQTYTGIVASNYDFERPMVFKSSPDLAYGRQATFEAGFDCRISEAVMASAAAFPFFRRRKIKTSNQGIVELMDGGFVANNPTLLAIADAITALKVPRERLRVLSLGVGHYKEPTKSIFHRVIFRLWWFQMINKMFATNTNTIETLRRVLAPDVRCVRVDDSFPDDQYATDLLESDPEKLEKLLILGRESFGKHQNEIDQLWEVPNA